MSAVGLSAFALPQPVPRRSLAGRASAGVTVRLHGGAGTGGGRPSFGRARLNSNPVMNTFQHVPVLLPEAVAWMAPAPGRRLVDGTTGGGGHSEALLERGATVLSLDRDGDALAAAGTRLAAFGARSILRRSDYREFPQRLQELGWDGIDGLLLDVGVSSWQIDAPGRGFSFQQDGPLDMRMDDRAGLTAAVVVNEWPEGELAQAFFRYGEEPRARRIAAAIVQRRDRQPLRTTAELAALVEEVSPRRGRLHPATKVFQALRMVVNDELGALEAALEAAPGWLRPGGRLVVISFHSLEDRLVKRFLRRCSSAELDRPEWPAPRPNPDHSLRLLTRRPVVPGEQELAGNPRARSARLRAAERLAGPGARPVGGGDELNQPSTDGEREDPER